MTVDWDSLIPHLVHDVRALARKGMSNAQLLQRALGSELAPDAAIPLGFVLESQRDLNRLITRIGTLAEADRLVPIAESDDLLEIQDIVLGVKIQWKDAIREAGGELVVGDMPPGKAPARLQAAIHELVDNATRYRRDEGPLRITIEARVVDDGLMELSVSDNGQGWNPAYAGKLFQPLERLEVRKGGCGLGLAIARALVESAGGKITGMPTTDVPGACFTIELPIA